MSRDGDAFDNIIAMANVGAAFSEIFVLEDLVAALVGTSKVTLRQKLSEEAISLSSLLLDRHKSVRSSTLGRLVDALEKSGIQGRDIRYLRAVVELRNDFIHRFGEQVPLPGDWARYGFSLEEFSRYTTYVMRHVSTARRSFARIMTRHGMLVGKFGDFGALLWNPDHPLPPGFFDEQGQR